MRRKSAVRRIGIRYSEAFKVAVVRELEAGEVPFSQISHKYGIRGACTVQKWARKYGRGDIGKTIRVDTPKAINERDELKQRIRALEKALADTQVDLAIERATTRVICQRAGITDLAEIKKKALGK